MRQSESGSSNADTLTAYRPSADSPSASLRAAYVPKRALTDTDPATTSSTTGPSLDVVRHPETGKNIDRRVRSQSDDPLTEHGMAEAKQMAKSFKSNPPDVVVASDMQRARIPAEMIGKSTGAKVIIDPAFRSWHLGKFVGMESKKVDPQIARYVEDSSKPVEGGGESFDQFKSRVFAGLDKVLRQYPREKVVLISHHRVERLLASWIKAGQRPDLSVDPTEMAKSGAEPGEVVSYTRDAGKGSARAPLKSAAVRK